MVANRAVHDEPPGRQERQVAKNRAKKLGDLGDLAVKPCALPPLFEQLRIWVGATQSLPKRRRSGTEGHLLERIEADNG